MLDSGLGEQPPGLVEQPDGERNPPIPPSLDEPLAPVPDLALVGVGELSPGDGVAEGGVEGLEHEQPTLVRALDDAVRPCPNQPHRSCPQR